MCKCLWIHTQDWKGIVQPRGPGYVGHDKTSGQDGSALHLHSLSNRQSTQPIGCIRSFHSNSWVDSHPTRLVGVSTVSTCLVTNPTGRRKQKKDSTHGGQPQGRSRVYSLRKRTLTLISQVQIGGGGGGGSGRDFFLSLLKQPDQV